MVTLQTVEIPGYAEAVRKESRIRDAAFLDGLEILCGVEVVPLCLRRLIWLEQARNGFVVPCRFDDANETTAHALQVMYFCTPSFVLPRTPRYSFIRSFLDNLRQNRFSRGVLRRVSAQKLIAEIEAWLKESFMDAPAGDMEGVITAPHASYPVYIMDKFAEAGLPFTYDEVMEMPLRRLWQHWRVALKRINDIPITNPSDQIAVDYLAKVKT